MLLVSYWWHRNGFLPRGDAAEYWLTSVDLYHRVATGPPLEALWSILEQRGWRGVLTPALGLPFLLLTGGELQPAVALKAICFYGVLVVYNYLFLLVFTKPARAALWANFIATMPAVLTLGTGRGDIAEPAFLASVCAAFYHGSRSDGMRSMRHTSLMGFWCGFASCSRPAETAVLVCLCAAVFLRHLLLFGHVTRRGIMAAALLVASAALLVSTPFWKRAWNPFAGRIGMSLAVAAAFATFAICTPRLLKLRSQLFAGLACASLVSLTWWLPELRALYYWATYASSVPDLAAVTGRDSSGFVATAFEVCQDLLTTTLLLVGLTVLLLRWKRPQALVLMPGSPVLATFRRLLAITFLALVLTSTFSPLSDPRFAFVGVFAAAWFVFLLYAQSRIVDAIVGLAVVTHIAGYSLLFGSEARGPLTMSARIATVSLPVSAHNLDFLRPRPAVDPQIQLFQSLLSRLPSGAGGLVALLPRWVQSDLELNVQTLALLARYHQTGWAFEVPWCRVSANMDHLQRRIHDYDYAFAGPVHGTLARWWPLQSGLAGKVIEAWNHDQSYDGLPVVATATVSMDGTDNVYLMVDPTTIQPANQGQKSLCPRGNGSIDG